MSVNYLYGTGRRKTSVARVRLLPGNGEMVVNGKPADEYFGGESKVAPIRLPFRVTETEVVVDIDLALITRPFKGKVETRLLQRLVAEFGD